MNEKLMITKAQHEVILEGLKKRKGDRAQLIGDHSVMRGSWIAEYRVLDELTVSDMARIVYDGDYEVEQQRFKAGDKLYGPLTLKKILNVISCSGRVVSVKEFSYPLPADEYRIATPEEVYWLETLGREKLFDFREGDAILDIHGDFTPINTEFQVNHAVLYFSNKTKNFKGIYPAESFKRYPQEEEK